MNKKQELLEKIAELFYKNGYEATSIRQICRNLGMTSAGLYYHFKNKQEMLFEIMNSAIEDALVSMRRELGKKSGAEDKIEWIIRAHIMFYCKNKCQTKVLVHERGTLENEYAEIIREKEREYVQVIRKVLMQITLENGRDVPVDAAVFYLLGTLNWIVHWFDPGGKISPDELADSVTTLFMNGVKGKT
ncbi:MAG: TetR/AcrR family transcriptional regulator [Desulfobacteraceae bacterium]|nr:MAG: TetR/AcrR family transcriptional regulator [Desulfobacteraceae bacterium]